MGSLFIIAFVIGVIIGSGWVVGLSFSLGILYLIFTVFNESVKFGSWIVFGSSDTKKSRSRRGKE